MDENINAQELIKMFLETSLNIEGIDTFCLVVGTDTELKMLAHGDSVNYPPLKGRACREKF